MAGSLGRYGGEFGTGMGTLIGVVAEDVDHTIAKSPFHAKEHLTQPATIGTEKVTVDENGQSLAARMAAAANVISLAVNRPKQTALI
jgi:hypothetical protein